MIQYKARGVPITHLTDEQRLRLRRLVVRELSTIIKGLSEKDQETRENNNNLRDEVVQIVDEALISQAMFVTDMKVTDASRILGINRNSLRKFMQDNFYNKRRRVLDIAVKDLSTLT